MRVMSVGLPRQMLCSEAMASAIATVCVAVMEVAMILAFAAAAPYSAVALL